MESKEIVRYHNDFNKVTLPSFTELEQNLLFKILELIKDKTANQTNITLYLQDFRQIATKNLTNKELAEIIRTFKVKFFSANFTILLEQGNLIGEATIHFFNKFIVWRDKDTVAKTNEVWDAFEKIEIEVNKHFDYLINSVLKNFTSFEFNEFLLISGKYAKTLYRLLKQYRFVGRLEFKWEQFKELLDIPKNYKMCDIDKFILKPAIKELTRERTLFDQRRAPFIGLNYIKIKGIGRGRGGKIVGIKFLWRAEKKAPKDWKPSAYSIKAEDDLESYKGRNIINDTNETLKISNIQELEAGGVEVTFKNCDTYKTFTKTFDSKAHFLNYLKKFHLM